MNLLALFLVLLVSSNLAWCADPVGRIILAAGEVDALRGGKVIALTKDAPVESGDEIHTGRMSGAQIRFADTSIVALRAETTFRVDDFRFKGEVDGSERAFFSLLKGGLRTITGVIGRVRRENYSVATPTSTIGIRGTNFNLVVCDDNCRNADGSIAPNGTYGGVTNGRIALTPNANPTAERVFAKGEYFFSPSTGAPPQPLLAPPTFLADKLEARQRSAPAASTPATAAATATTSPKSESAAIGTLAPNAMATTTISTLPYIATEALTTSGTPAVINRVTGFIAQYYDGFTYVATDSCGGSPGTCPTNSASQFSTSGISLTGYSNSGSPTKGSLVDGTVVDAGSARLNGNLFAWGRWTGGFSVTDSTGATLSNLPSGVLFGLTDDPTANGSGHIWPTSGMIAYSLAGGPSPVDANGNVGRMNSMSGTLDFVTRNVTLNANMAIAIPTHGNATLTMSGSGTIASGNDNLLKAPITTACSGSGCASASSSGLFDARFAGTAAQVMVVNGIAQNAVKDSRGVGSRSVLFLNLLKCTSGC